MRIKRRFAKPIAVAALLMCVIVSLPLFTVGCGVSLTYGGNALISGRVGVEYMAYVGTATGSDEIVYELKEGSALPQGLELDPDGFVIGTPEAKAAEHKFTVVASAEGALSEAEFTITVSEGELAYESGAVKVAKEIAFDKSVATASGATTITYALTEDSSLPDGVELTSDGRLVGEIVKVSQYEFSIVASATDCASATATFTLNVVKPWLDYSPIALRTATAGSYFTGAVASAADGTGAGENLRITYTLKSGSSLPEGLELATNGLIYGTPTETGTAQFTVVARASGYDSAEADFKIKTNPAFTFEAQDGTITFSDNDVVSVEVNTQFIRIGAISASASNRLPVTFEITSGTLPTGVTFYPNGTLAGLVSKAGNYPLTITATAEKCEPVEREITFAALVTLIYSNVNLSSNAENDLYVGEACEVSLARAAFPSGYENSGAVITYAVKSGLPEGLALSESGILTGTPVKSVRTFALTVTASAEGFSSKDATFTLHIEDAYVSGVTRFEVEYTDLRGLIGSGYSGASPGANMIGSTSEVSASRSKDGKNYEEVLGGYYIPYVYGPITFTYKIVSSKAVTGVRLSVGLDSEIGTIAIDQRSFNIAVNGTACVYSLTVPGAEDRKLTGFRNYVIGNVNLTEGENIITVSVLANNLNGSGTGGPAVDYLQLENLGDASLSWRPALYNRPSYTQS